MIERERLQTLFSELVQGADQAKRDYAADTLLASLWIETGRERERTAATLCGLAPFEAEGELPLSAVRLCRKLAEGEGAVPLPPPPSAERRRGVGDAAAEVLKAAYERLAAHRGTAEERESPAAKQEAQCLFDLLRMMELLRLPALQPWAFFFLSSSPCAEASWHGSLKEAACRGLASLPVSYQKLIFAALGAHGEQASALLPVLDYLNSSECVPDVAGCLRYSTGALILGKPKPQVWEQVVWGVLKTLERIGDRRALPELKRLLDPGGFVRPFQSLSQSRPPRLSPELKTEIVRVIGVIQSGHSGERQTLLRASSLPGDQLLRPSSGETNDGRGDLLRPK